MPKEQSQEQIAAEAKTFTPTKSKTPVKTGKTQKAVVNNELTDVEVTERYPRTQQSENLRVTVLSPMTGVPMVQISPVGWVGAPPLSIPETRLDELIELLSKVR